MRGKRTYREERTIYMIKPEFLVQDLLRVFDKLGLHPELSGGGGAWLLRGSSGDRSARVELTSTYELVEGLRTLGPIPVNKLDIYVEGPEDFIRAFKRRVEVELLRCLG